MFLSQRCFSFSPLPLSLKILTGKNILTPWVKIKKKNKKERGRQGPHPAASHKPGSVHRPSCRPGEPLKHFKQRCDSKNWGSKWEAGMGAQVRKDGGLNAGARGGHI